MFVDLILPGLLVATINIIIMYVLFKHKFMYLEYLPPIFISIFIGLIIKFSGEGYKTTDYEYHGGWVVRIENQKSWTEWYEVDVDDYCTNSKGERYVCGSHKETRYWHHPETWELTDSNGYSISIDDLHYSEIESIWGQKSIVEAGHSDDYHFYSGDGRFFYCNWNSLKLIPCTTLHSYTNKIQAAEQSLFAFREIDKSDKERFGLYEYEPIYSYYKNNYISGNAPDKDLANKKLEEINAILGAKKQISIRILLFNNKPIEAAIAQESYWKGGNKNEFIICIGHDESYNIKWSHVISWTKEMKLKIQVRDIVRSMPKLDLIKVIDESRPMLEKDFKRREFKEFNYLDVQISFGEKVFSFILILILTGLFDWFAVMNELTEKDNFEFMFNFSDFLKSIKKR